MALRLFADNNVPIELALALRRLGHDVTELAPTDRAQSDLWILRRAFTDGRNVLTLDKDFENLVLNGRHAAIGVILLRVGAKGAWPPGRAKAVAELIAAHEAVYAGAVVTVRNGGIEVAPIP